MNDLFYGFYPTQEPNPGLSGRPGTLRHCVKLNNKTPRRCIKYLPGPSPEEKRRQRKIRAKWKRFKKKHLQQRLRRELDRRGMSHSYRIDDLDGLSGVVQRNPGSLYYGLGQSSSVAATVNEQLAALDNAAVELGDRIQQITNQTLKEQLNEELAALVAAIRQTLREVAATATPERALEIQQELIPQMQSHFDSLTSAVRRAVSGKQVAAVIGVGLVGIGSYWLWRKYQAQAGGSL